MAPIRPASFYLSRPRRGWHYALGYWKAGDNSHARNDGRRDPVAAVLTAHATRGNFAAPVCAARDPSCFFLPMTTCPASPPGVASRQLSCSDRHSAEELARDTGVPYCTLADRRRDGGERDGDLESHRYV